MWCDQLGKKFVAIADELNQQEDLLSALKPCAPDLDIVFHSFEALGDLEDELISMLLIDFDLAQNDEILNQIKAIRAIPKYKYCVVIAMANALCADGVLMGLDAGVDVFLEKPISNDRVKKAIYTAQKLMLDRSHWLELEAKLRDRERNYSEILDILPDIVYQIDLNGHFVYVNNAVSNMGYTPAELIGQHYNILFDNSMEVDRVSRNVVIDQIRERGPREHSPKLFDERRTGERRTEHLEVRLKYKKGEVFPSELSAFGDISSQGFSGQLSTQGRGVVAGTIGVIHDITRYKLMETQLKEAIGNMEKESLKRKEAEKIFELDRGELMKQSDELETFAYRVAHDLKSPLLFLRSLIELFRSGDVDKEQVLEKLDSGLNRSLSLVNGLYNLGRLKRKDHSWGNISLVDMVKEVSEWLEADMRIKKINLSIDCPDVVFAIEDVLPLVFLNLISNALKYNLSENPQIRITSRPDEGKILIKVEDNGPGLPVTAEKKIFEAFVQLDKSRLKEGLGVGLNTVCNALLLHDSEVWVSRSKDLGGACLSFVLTPAQKSSQEISEFMEES